MTDVEVALPNPLADHTYIAVYYWFRTNAPKMYTSPSIGVILIPYSTAVQFKKYFDL